MRSNLFYRDVQPHLEQLIDELFRQVPTGVGRGGKYHFDRKELRQLMARGLARILKSAAWPTQRRHRHTEAHGRLDGAEPDNVSERALDARRRPVRHARLGQPLPGSAGRRCTSSTTRPRR